MHLFTITIQTNLFLKDFSDNIHAIIAVGFYKKFYNLMVRHQLSKMFHIDAYWRKGCIIEDFVLNLKNKDLIKEFSKSEEAINESEDYKILENKLYKLQNIFREKKIDFGKINLGDINFKEINHVEIDFEEIKLIDIPIEIKKILFAKNHFQIKGQKIDKELLKIIKIFL